jgi:hypothetical protein
MFNFVVNASKKIFLSSFVFLFFVLLGSFLLPGTASAQTPQTCANPQQVNVTGCDASCKPTTKGYTTLKCVNCKTTYIWKGCYLKNTPPTGPMWEQSGPNLKCYMATNEVENWPCDSGTGGVNTNPYIYTRCPAGTTLSCGSPEEATEQNKVTCTYKKTCNKYFWPSLITLPSPCNAKNPVSAMCQWNCSCCPTGTTRICTTGANYTKKVTIDLTNGEPGYNETAKVLCNTHDDIFLSNVKTRDYWVGNDHLQDWTLSCKVNTCKCSSPTTPTPTPTKKPTSTPTKTPTPIPGCNQLCNTTTGCAQPPGPSNISCVTLGSVQRCRNVLCPNSNNCRCPDKTPTPTPTLTNTPTPLPPLVCEQMEEFIGAVNITNNLDVIKKGDEVTFTATINNTGRIVNSMTFQYTKVIDGVVTENLVVPVPAVLSGNTWKSDYKKVIDAYGSYRVKVISVSSL